MPLYPAIPTPVLGYYIPPSWGQFWQPKRNAAGSGKATIAWIGDSVSRGYYSSNLDTKSAPGLIASSLKSTYGDGGSGFKGAFDSSTFATAKGINAAAISAYQTTGNYSTQTGTWTLYSGLSGPSEGYALQTVDNTTPASVSYTGQGTSFTIYTISSNSPVNAAYKYQVDGGAFQNVSNTATYGVQKTTVSGLSTGSHTVKIVYNDDGTHNLYVIGVSFENSTGIVVNNYSIYGEQTSAFALQTAFTDGSVRADWLGGYKYPADLVVLSIGLNDAANNTSGDTWSKYIREILRNIRDGSGLVGSTDIIFLIQHVGKYDNTNFVYQDYCSRARGLAEAYNAALIDMWTIGQNSWNYWNGLNYWGNSATPGSSGGDSVHPCDAGHQAIANAAMTIINS